ncbi:MAG TPA: patatin-like phospholipase family protein [Usitatibacteraceae bacterium]|nr:patatin-like phospholipase family protein [Usitatibacteraceae bacterium]
MNRPAAATAGTKAVSLALQGGGSHGAYAWGILDRFLEDGRLSFEGLSGTSAGSVNAALCAYGLLLGGAEGAREKLDAFWRGIARTGSFFNPGGRFPFEAAVPGWPTQRSLTVEAFKAMTGSLSPYQWNPLNFNPLRDALENHVDFERLRTCKVTKLFVSATNVRTGRGRVFKTDEVSVDVVLASACLPQLFQAVEIEGDPYWDGGFMGNPVLYPLFYETRSRDVIIVHINPIERPGTPRLPHEIENRLNEITFNASLIKELRAVAFVQKLLAEGWIKDEFRGQLKDVLMHSIRADKALCDLSVASKFDVSWPFLAELRNRGRETAGEWLEMNWKDIGLRSTVDVRKEFL